MCIFVHNSLYIITQIISPQIGERPAITSLSLGSTRRFKLLHKASGERVDYDLKSGSVLGCQEDWEHAVLKTARPVGERIN
ncbi:MAG: hypothetical protein LH609_07005 [Rudanella sp.]|nr:hypothetical protein [Rudanella sp.]